LKPQTHEIERLLVKGVCFCVQCSMIPLDEFWVRIRNQSLLTKTQNVPRTSEIQHFKFRATWLAKQTKRMPSRVCS